MRTTNCSALVLSLIATGSAWGLQVGLEIPVKESKCGVSQHNVVISRDSSRTLIAFDESESAAEPSRVVLHQYEANVGVPRGRETFALDSSSNDQRRPAFGQNMIAWIEEDANGQSSLWWQGLSEYTVGTSYRPVTDAERVADVAPETGLTILNTHVFHVMLWTAPDGRLKGAYRSLIARIGYDPNPFYVSNEPALNPSAGVPWSATVPLVAYNYEVPQESCTGTCAPQYAIRATVLGGSPGPQTSPQAAIDIAPAGASAPRVVFNGTDFVVFWSMKDGGTFAQRVTSAGGAALRIGEPLQIHDGAIHDATVAPNDRYMLAVERGPRRSLLHLDRDLQVVETIPFLARLDAGATVSLSGSSTSFPILAYAAQRTGDCGASQAILRVLDDSTAPRKRRSVR